MPDTNLTAGSIAFTNYNADGTAAAALSFAALTDIPAGTVITFTSGLWNGTAFGKSEGTWTWTATDNVTAGTVITMDKINSTAPISNHGNIAFPTGVAPRYSDTYVTYAYVGAPSAPQTFLAAITGTSLTGFVNNPATLNGTGLTEGLNAIAFQPNGSTSYDIAVYNGPRLGSANFSDYLAMINNRANWSIQGGLGDQSHDGVTPDLPFSQAGFSTDPNAQVVSFDAGSVSVSQAEGNSGDTIMTFTVVRTGGTTGELNFSGLIDISGKPLLNAGDFAQGLSFSGTIADGATSGVVTIHITGDTTFESNEVFTLVMNNVSNSSVAAVLGASTVATGTIANDDPAPVKMAFTGINTDNTDHLAFAVFTDIAAGTVIRFSVGTAANATTTWTWTASEDIKTGSIVTMDDLATASASSNHGTIAFGPGVTKVDLDSFGTTVFAYLGAPGQPDVYLAAIGTNALGDVGNIGLTLGVNALQLSSSTGSAAYVGPHVGFTNYDAYMAAINTKANWVSQNQIPSTGTANDGVTPDLPFPTYPFSIDQTAQQVDFATSSLKVTQQEGAQGTTTTFTFTVQRTNGTTGDLAFSVAVLAELFAGSANAADFGETLPVVTGVIADGQSSTTISITVTGDSVFEANEIFHLAFQSASNPAANVVIGNNTTATGTITNDDVEPGEIFAGETVTQAVTLSGSDFIKLHAGGAIDLSAGVGGTPITWKSGNATIDNAGNILTKTGSAGIAILGDKNATGTLAITNSAGGYDYGEIDLHKVGTSAVITITNAGTITSFTKTIEMANATGPNQDWIHNLATGVITTAANGQDVIRAGAYNAIENAGFIGFSPDPSSANSGGDAVDFQSNQGGSVHNLAGGSIVGSRHAITGDFAVTVINDAGATLEGRNGSGINIDNDGSVANTEHVTNYGNIIGRSQNYADSDGDAVDVDGLLQLDNYSNVMGVGANGYHDGEANVSEGVAAGGGIINNYAGAQIYGYGRAIQIDNSSNGPAVGATTIYNEGLIQGDGHGPTGVSDADAAAMNAKIKNREAINIVGSFADTITNKGRIVGGVFTDGGNDVFNAYVGSSVSGMIDLGDGNDTVNLYATPGANSLGNLGQLVNVENLNFVSGSWKVNYFYSGANQHVYGGASIVAGTAAAAMSLSGGQTLTVDQGGLVQGTKTAIFISGGTVDANIVNSGTINVTSRAGTDKADAISLNGATATIHNTSTGVIVGGRHAITGPISIHVINDAGGYIIGQNGSAVNMDNSETEDHAAFVTNYGTMLGESANISDSDGDAVDVDGLLHLENYGSIRGEGANGYHKGEVNVSEGVAIGGGTINNYAGGEIYGYGRAIQVDNSSNGAAFASTTIYNEGLIQGDGHGPTGVADADAAAMNVRIKNREAIDILGSFADTITNKGRIVGGVFTDGGNDVFNAYIGSTVTGLIDLGSGSDTLNLYATAGSNAAGVVGQLANVETVKVVGGNWTLSKGTGSAGVEVENGAVLNLAAGSINTGAIVIDNGGVVFDYGTVNNATVQAGGALHVYDGGSASNTRVEAGGYQDVWNNATATGTSLGGNQQVLAGGSAIATTIENGGYQYVGAGGEADGTVIHTGGFQYVDVGGTANGTVVSGGYQIVMGAVTGGSSGGGSSANYGISISATIKSGGAQHIYDGGQAISATIETGGFQDVVNAIVTGTRLSGNQQVLAGGSAINTIVQNGGNQFVGTGGATTGSVINAGGLEYVDVGANAANTSVRGGYLYAGGTVSGASINNGGELEVTGTANNTKLVNGVEHVHAGGVQNGVDFGGGASGVLFLDKASGLTGTISNFEAGDAISLGGTSVSSFAFDGTTLTLATAGGSVAYQFSGLNADATFNVTSNGHGGSTITLLTQYSASLTSETAAESTLVPQQDPNSVLPTLTNVHA